MRDAERRARLTDLIAEAHQLVDTAVAEHVTADRRTVAATCILFSGGNDSTVLAHLMRGRADYAIHANTGIGIEATRQFVRDTCQGWGLPLIEEHPPPGCTYEELVVDRGFPGPAQHWKMYTRLKERCLEQARNKLVGNPYRERRSGVPQSGRKKSMVWVSPLVNWTAIDLNTYRMANPDCPRNEVADLIHMSGECLCGAFAKRGELDEIGEWFPDVRADIEALQEKVRAAGHPEEMCRWGWGAYRTRQKRSPSGLLCSSCEARS